jgi:ATP-dependent Clp protease ATP-binding subunit ClpB
MATVRLEIVELLRKRLRPEFLNRVDEVILFKPLVPSEIQKIARIQIDAVATRLHELGITLHVTENCIEWLGRRGYDVQLGARPLKRVIQRYLADPLALKVLGAEVRAGDTVTADCDDNGRMTFVTSGADAAPPDA